MWNLQNADAVFIWQRGRNDDQRLTSFINAAHVTLDGSDRCGEAVWGWSEVAEKVRGGKKSNH